MLRDIRINLEYQSEIPGPPYHPDELYRRACDGDKVTVEHWRGIWSKNYQAAKEHFGSLGEYSIGRLFGLNRHRPAIVIGSGPSLRQSIEALKVNQVSKNPVLTVSCLHNLGYFEDEGINVDYYLTLDAGPAIFKDVYEGRKFDEGHYWEQTKGKKLIAYGASDPRLWGLWQGDVYLFNSMIPDEQVRNEFDAIEPFSHYVSSGGNALGACMYISKAVMGSSEIIYVGGDFCFDYDGGTFHSYATEYDKPGNYVRVIDVFGNSRRSWQSYVNFKYWLDKVACTVPGSWVNASEGILGAYREGNIKQFKYMTLREALIPYQMADTLYLEDQATKTKEPFDLEEFWKNSKSDKKMTFF